MYPEKFVFLKLVKSTSKEQQGSGVFREGGSSPLSPPPGKYKINRKLRLKSNT